MEVSSKYKSTYNPTEYVHSLLFIQSMAARKRLTATLEWDKDVPSVQPCFLYSSVGIMDCMREKTVEYHLVK